MSRPARAFRRARQCSACPWKVRNDPRTIPNGYDPERHRALIACQGETTGDLLRVHAMACHESAPDDEYACVGWMDNQLGPGNNLGLRLRAIHGEVPRRLRLDGPQHPSVRAMCEAAPRTTEEDSDGGSAVGSAGPAAE